MSETQSSEKINLNGQTFIEFVAAVCRLFLQVKTVDITKVAVAYKPMLQFNESTKVRLKPRSRYVSLRIQHPDFGEHTVVHFEYPKVEGGGGYYSEASRKAPDAALVNTCYELLNNTFNLDWLKPEEPSYNVSASAPEDIDEADEDPVDGDDE